jgi:hypothetical protein
MKTTIDIAREAGWPDSLISPVIMAKLADFEVLVRSDERNACAKLCEAEAIDEHENGSWIACAEYLSKNIRARS